MAKEIKKEEPQVEAKKTNSAAYVPTDLVIKEIMIQKGISREAALEFLTKK